MSTTRDLQEFPLVATFSVSRTAIWIITLTVINASLFYVFLPRLVRKYASQFKIGQIGLFSLKNVEWQGHRVWVKGRGMVLRSESISKLEESGVGQRTRVTLGSLGLKFGTNEGSRRQWIALGIESVRIKIPSAHLQPQPLTTTTDVPLDTFEVNTSDDESPQNSSSPGSRQDVIGSQYSLSWDLISKFHAEFSCVMRLVLERLPPRLQLLMRSLFKVSRLIRMRILRPLLYQLNRLGRRLSWVISVFGLEINDILVEIDEVSTIRCSIKIGFQLVRGDQSQICCWITFKNVCVEKSGDCVSDQPRRTSPVDIASNDQDTVALNFPGCIELSASAGLDPVVGLATILTSKKRSGSLRKSSLNSYTAHRLTDASTQPSGQLIRPHSVNFKVKFIENASNNPRTARKLGLPIQDASARSVFLSINNIFSILNSFPHQTGLESKTIPSSPSYRSTTPPADTLTDSKLSFLPILRQLTIELPSVYCYHLLPGPMESPDPYDPPPTTSHTSPERIFTYFKIDGLDLDLDLSEEKTERGLDRSAHIEWFGRGTSIPLRFRAHWKVVSLGVRKVYRSNLLLEPLESDIIQHLKISETSFLLSSSWVPDALRKKCALHRYFSSSVSHISFTGDHNDHMVIAEVEVGRIKGQVSVDHIATLNRLWNMVFAQPCHGAKLNLTPPKANEASSLGTFDKKPELRRNLPRFVTGVIIHSIAYDICGPGTAPVQQPKPGARFHSSGNDSVLSFSCAAFHFNSTGEYSDLTVKRTDTERRHMRVRARRAEIFVPQYLRSVSISQAHEKEITGEGSSLFDYTSSPHLEDDLSYEDRPGTRSKNKNSGRVTHGPFLQAYPLPAPSSKISQWRSRTEIFREMDSVHFLYELEFTFSTSAINAIFSDGSTCMNPNSGNASIRPLPGESSLIRHELLSILSIQVTSQLELAGWDSILPDGDLIPSVDLSLREGTVQSFVGEIALDLWRSSVHASLIRLSHAIPSEKSMKSQPRTSISRTERIPSDVVFSLAVSKAWLRSAASDPAIDSQSIRGIKLEIHNLLLESFRQSSARPTLYICPERLRLDLKEDIRVQANSKLLQNPEYNSCFFKCAIQSIQLIAVADVNQSSIPSSTHSKTLLDGRHLQPAYSQSQWELNSDSSPTGVPPSGSTKSPTARHTGHDFDPGKLSTTVFSVNRLACRITLQAHQSSDIKADEMIVALEANPLNFHIDAFRIYCTLLGMSALIALTRGCSPVSKSDPTSAVSETRRSLQVGIRSEIKSAQFHIFLSPQVPIFIELRRLSLQRSKKLGLDVRWDTMLLAGRSVTSPELWDDILKIKTCKIKVVETQSHTLAAGLNTVNRGWHPYIIIIDSDAARLRIPFKFVIADMIESASILVKTIRQLFYRIIKDGEASILEPVLVTGKRIPEIRVKFRIVVFQAEDDPFENKLNAIRRAGKEEVKERLMRDESFEHKVREMKNSAKSTTTHSQSKRHWGNSSSSSTESFAEDDGSSSTSSSFGQTSHPQSRVSIEEAARRLEEYNAAAWIKRIRNALAEQERQEDGIQRQLYGHTNGKIAHLAPVEMVPRSKATPLLRAVFNSIQIAFYKADFAKEENGLVEYLHRVGKGLPKDTQFSLLIPIHISWQMEGAVIRLRDFPLHLFSLPRPQAQNGDQQERDQTHYTWQFETDFVIAEEMCGAESIRIVPGLVVPPYHSPDGIAYSLDIPKSVMPVKSYADPVVKIKSASPIRIGWGNSMQPTIQDMMRVLDSLTKAPVDPSERVGFWDKVRLVLHWMIEITFVGSKADLVLHLKGSRDPYELLGSGAGFAKVWRGNIKLLLGLPNDQQEFLQIKSDRFILGIPNLKDLIDNAATGSTPMETATSAATYKKVYQQRSRVSDSDEADEENTSQSRRTEFMKIVGNLTNGVRWGMGIVLERACDGDQKCNCVGSAFHRKCRLFTFKPHYEVVTKTPECATTPSGNPIDSYKGFRSDFIHFSISLTSPTDVANLPRRPSGQNSLYFSPEAFTHFWSWWNTFDSALSLPIRQGKLFPSAQASSKKFGRHVATMKYRFGISPLFLAHTYKYENVSDWANGKSAVLGFKAKISTFNVDLHSRAIETTIRKPEMKQPQKIIRKAFYQAEVDCQDVNIRAVSAVFHVARKAKYAADLGLAVDQDEAETSSIWEEDEEGAKEMFMGEPGGEGFYFFNTTKLSIQDQEWIDPDDFSDLFFWPHNNSGKSPQIKLFDFISCPRITYLRKPSRNTPAHSTQSQAAGGGTEWENLSDEQPVERTKFGKEDTHTCFIGKAEDPMSVQVGLLESRLRELVGEKYQCLLSLDSGVSDHNLKTKLQQIIGRMETLENLKSRMLTAKASLNQRNSQQDATQLHSNSASMESTDWAEGEKYLLEMAKQLSDENSGWSNRLLVHNPSILISNSTRDIMLKYYYSYSQRRGYMYHISARAVKLILELAKPIPESNEPKQEASKRKSRWRSRDFHNFDKKRNSGPSIDARSAQLHLADNSIPSFFNLSESEQAEQDIPDDFAVDPADLVLLMRPQIAFRSDVDEESTIILTAFHAQLKCFEVLDSSHLEDPVNANVMKRNFGTIRGFQMFYPLQPPVNSADSRSHLFSHGCLVPLEVLVDLRLEPWGFDRLIGRCTVDIAYDVFNKLRFRRRSAGAEDSLSAASQPHLRSSTDFLRVETADALSVHANATHYRAIYNVVTDLCFYLDPAQKKRNAALETMQFAYDVDDLAGMAEEIQHQQAQIRLYRRKLAEEYVYLNRFDEIQLADLSNTEYHLSLHVSDLNLMVEAIRRSQAIRVDRSKAEALPGSQLQAHAKIITWHMLADNGEAIAKLSITDTRLERYSLPDTSVSNRLYVQDMLALNISADPDRLFDEILSRYEALSTVTGSISNSKNFLMVIWKTLPPIAGISIVESFLLEIHPIRLQIEHAIGLKVHDYLFGHKSSDASTEGPDSSKSNNESDERTSYSTTHRLRRSRSVSQTNQKHRTNSRGLALLATERRPMFNLGPIAPQEVLAEVPSRQRPRTGDNSGFLNAEWKSALGANLYIPSSSNRSSRAPSIRSVSSDGRIPQMGMSVSSNSLLTWNKQRADEAAEMKKRAQLYKSFLFIDVAPTVLCVSYSGPKYPDIFDLVVKVPAFHFESRTWSYKEFFDEMRKTCVSSLFKQSPSILGQIITTARKNKSVPKMMGQKMASGFKLKRKNMFERGGAHSPRSADATYNNFGSHPMAFDDASSINPRIPESDKSGLSSEAANSKLGPSPLRFLVEAPSGSESSHTDRTEAKNGTPRPSPVYATTSPQLMTTSTSQDDLERVQTIRSNSSTGKREGFRALFASHTSKSASPELNLSHSIPGQSRYLESATVKEVPVSPLGVQFANLNGLEDRIQERFGPVGDPVRQRHHSEGNASSRAKSDSYDAVPAIPFDFRNN